jgi:hypothetical protein
MTSIGYACSPCIRVGMEGRCTGMFCRVRLGHRRILRRDANQGKPSVCRRQHPVSEGAPGESGHQTICTESHGRDVPTGTGQECCPFPTIAFEPGLREDPERKNWQSSAFGGKGRRLRARQCSINPCSYLCGAIPSTICSRANFRFRCYQPPWLARRPNAIRQGG